MTDLQQRVLIEAVRHCLAGHDGSNEALRRQEELISLFYAAFPLNAGTFEDTLLDTLLPQRKED